MNVCFLGGYDRAYPRNAVLRRGLELAGAEVSECHIRPGRKFWLRYPALFVRSLGRRARASRFFLVPEFCQKDVPLARFLAALGSRRVVFDPLATRFETKFVDWGWGPTDSAAARWNRWIDALAFRLSDLILADTAAHRDYYARFFGLPAERFAVVPVGFDDRLFSRELAERGKAARASAASANGPFTVLFFGSFLPLHGVEFIIEAANLVWAQDKDVRFLLIGGGRTFARAADRAAELGPGNIAFEGWKNLDELAAAVASRADVCLGVFGRTEKAERVVPHKVFQSMALGKPVVTGRTPAVAEFFEDGRNILLCDRSRPESLAEAVLTLKNDRERRESIGRRAFDLAWERFRPAALGEELAAVLGKMES